MVGAEEQLEGIDAEVARDMIDPSALVDRMVVRSDRLEPCRLVV
jgi:hypothetical protein